jgi:hypothetical protein
VRGPSLAQGIGAQWPLVHWSLCPNPVVTQALPHAHATTRVGELAHSEFALACLCRYASQIVDHNITCVGYRKASQGCIGLTNFTQYAYRAMFDEELESFPGVDGLVGRC